MYFRTKSPNPDWNRQQQVRTVDTDVEFDSVARLLVHKLAGHVASVVARVQNVQ